MKIENKHLFILKNLIFNLNNKLYKLIMNREHFLENLKKNFILKVKITNCKNCEKLKYIFYCTEDNKRYYLEGYTLNELYHLILFELNYEFINNYEEIGIELYNEYINNPIKYFEDYLFNSDYYVFEPIKFIKFKHTNFYNTI